MSRGPGVIQRAMTQAFHNAPPMRVFTIRWLAIHAYGTDEHKHRVAVIRVMDKFLPNPMRFKTDEYGGPRGGLRYSDDGGYWTRNKEPRPGVKEPVPPFAGWERGNKCLDWTYDTLQGYQGLYFERTTERQIRVRMDHERSLGTRGRAWFQECEKNDWEGLGENTPEAERPRRWVVEELMAWRDEGGTSDVTAISTRTEASRTSTALGAN
jgi:hypothetical protein